MRRWEGDDVADTRLLLPHLAHTSNQWGHGVCGTTSYNRDLACAAATKSLALFLEADRLLGSGPSNDPSHTEFAAIQVPFSDSEISVDFNTFLRRVRNFKHLLASLLFATLYSTLTLPNIF